MNYHKRFQHSPINTPLCPHCGIPMVKRHGQYGYFWSCPNYPRCPFTLNYPHGKLSANQSGFLEELVKIEKLSSKFIDNLQHIAKEEKDKKLIATYYHKFLSDYETELNISKKKLELYLSQSKFSNSQSYINTICGLVYYRYTKSFYDIGFYADAMKTISTALNLVSSSDMRYNELIALQRRIQQKVPTITTSLIDHTLSPSTISVTPLPEKTIPQKSKNHFGFIHISMCIGISILLFFLFTGYYHPYTPKKSTTITTTSVHNKNQSSPITPKYSPLNNNSNNTFFSNNLSKNIAPFQHGTTVYDSPSINSKYVGNIKTGKFHVSGCRAERRIKYDNKIPIDSREAAINAGYVPCQICNP